MDVIREVLIRGRMEILKADLAVPDITAFTKQLEQQNQFAQQQAKFLDELLAKQLAREQEAARVEANEQQRREAEAKAREDRKKAADERAQQKKAEADAAKAAAEAAKAAAEVEKQAEKARQEAAQAAAAAEQERLDAIEATNRARDAAIGKERQINDSLLKGGDALKQAGDGAFAFARGLTLIGLEGNASLEQVARQVASVQAKFDLFRGSVDLLKGGVEAARNFGKAIELAGGAVALLTTRMATLVAFLGPAGLVAIAAGALTAVVITLFQSMEDEVADFTANSERNLARFVGAAERAAAQAQAAFEKQDAVRETLSGQAKIDAIQNDLSNIKPAEDVATIIEKERAAFEELFDRQNVTEEQLAKERERIQAQTLAGFDAAAAEKGRRQQLGRELLGATTSRDQGADQGRETAIREVQRVEEESRRKVERRQEELKRAQEQEAERQRQIAFERSQLSAADAAFVQGSSGKIGELGTEALQKLGKLAPTAFGQDVKDEFIRREGGTPAERVDEVAALKTELAALTEALKAQSATRQGLQAADSAADAEAEAGAEKIRGFLRSIATEIEQINVERQKTESFYKEGNS